jgi:D-alanyl-D-alanine carboxypeptidase
MQSKPGTSLFKLRNVLLLSVLTVLTFSCKKSGSGGGGTSAAITSFSFQQAANPIPVSSTAAISGTSVSIFLPAATNPNALIANFTLSDSAIVRVNGITQQSGVTPVNFSAPVTYTVTAQNGSVQSYTVTLITGIASIDQNVAFFMNQYNIPSLSIAITLNEKLVYAQAYGQADVENNKAATTQNLFRVAALSQQITSAAIMKLMDQGKINMSDKVFGPGAILGTTFGTKAYTAWITNITVGELLHHTCGGWANNDATYPDPMFTNPTLTAQQLISWTLDNIPLINPPGTSYGYSNFDYCILGRVIEKITGMTYAQAAQSLVLQPSGISDMLIAGNTLAQRVPAEVKYYGQSGEDPYGFNITRMDAHSGWIASATDMAKFLVHVDGQSPETILSPNALSVMTTGSTANPNYACGWLLDGSSWYHPGGLPGTGSDQTVSVAYGNFNFVILTNSRSLDPNFDHDMRNIFWAALPNTPNWPGYDLFQNGNSN